MADPVADLETPISQSLLEWPADLSTQTDNFIQFTRYVYSRAAIEDTAKAQLAPGGGTITLPVPASLSNKYGVDWSNKELGIAGAEIARTASQFADPFVKNIQQGGQGFISSVTDAWSKSGISKDNFWNYSKAALIDGITSFDLAERALFGIGKARNPHKAVMFNAPEFRSFSFSYQLTARNFEESQTIRDIVQQFKLGMAPSFTESSNNNLFDYPDMFQITLNRPEFLFRFLFCVLTDLEVNYHAQNTPAYFVHEGQKIPAAVAISLSFQETEIITREMFEELGL